MKPVCFLCQEYEIDIGHQTILCPKQFCKICQQKGHFAMNCKTFCKDFTTKDEQMVKLENEDETKTEKYITVKKDLVKTEKRNCGELSKSEEDSLIYCLESMPPPCNVESKPENFITVKKELIKKENQNCDEFSKSEEEALMYCLESMSPKKRKIGSELRVGLPLEEVQQKIIEKLSNNLGTLTESKRQMEIELNDAIKDKDIESRKYQSQVVKRFNEIQKYQDQKEIIEKLSKKVEILCESKKEMEIELHKKIHDKVTELREYQSHAEKTLELKNIQLKHKESVKSYYQKWMEDRAQSLIDATTYAFKAGKLPKVVNGGVSILPSLNLRPNMLGIPIIENLEEVNNINNQQKDAKDC